MKKVKLMPLNGIEIEKIGTIKFGDSKELIEEKIGIASDEHEGSLYYDNLEMRFDFDEKSLLEFVEILGPYCEYISPEIYKINPFKLTANELIKTLSLNNNGKIDDTEAPHCYAFLGSSVGVWREVTDTEVKKEIKEARDNGEYEQWMEDDLEKSKYFWTIGLGAKDYYKY